MYGIQVWKGRKVITLVLLLLQECSILARSMYEYSEIIHTALRVLIVDGAGRSIPACYEVLVAFD